MRCEIKDYKTTEKSSGASPFLGWNVVLYCWGLVAVKIMFPHFVLYLWLNYHNIWATNLSAILRARVGLIPLEQWLSVTVVGMVIYLTRRVLKHCAFNNIIIAIAVWVSLSIACCLILYEWFVQYPAIIDLIGVQPCDAKPFLAPLNKL